MMDNDELKSDIFQVKIDSPAAFNLNLPIYHKRGQKDNIEDTLYASLVLKICHRTLGRNVVTEATDIEYCDGKVKNGRTAHAEPGHSHFLLFL